MLIDKERLKAKEQLISNLQENFALQEKLQMIRQSSAHELHSEIASGMSDLSIYTGLIEKEIQQEQDKIRFLTSQIRSRSAQMLDALHDLIWSLNPENRSIEQLHAKLIQLSREKLVPYNITWKVDINEVNYSVQPDSDLMRKSVSLYRYTLDFVTSKNVQLIEVMFDKAQNALLIKILFSTDIDDLSEQFDHHLRKTNATSRLEPNKLEIKLSFTRISD
jgi:glucose-6-phosphate-specific signal transduction histidine kinase